jgi:hypothetical protein
MVDRVLSVGYRVLGTTSCPAVEAAAHSADKAHIPRLVISPHLAALTRRISDKLLCNKYTDSQRLTAMSVDKLVGDIREVLADIKSVKSYGEKGKDGGQMVALYGKWSSSIYRSYDSQADYGICSTVMGRSGTLADVQEWARPALVLMWLAKLPRYS